jgi:uncharacterized protein with von Willebrand factor type A (vWA) domain
MISRHDDLQFFDQTFDLFWRERPAEMETRDEVESPLEEVVQGELPDQAELEEVFEQTLAQETGGSEEEGELPGYSRQEVFRKKDFSRLSLQESQAMSKAILKIAQKIATRVSRRKVRSERGKEVDLRGTFRRNMKYGGEVLELDHRKRRIKKTRIVLLCDVSGSMDCYSRFLIQFMYGLQNELWGVETFVFSTRLSRITHLIRSRQISEALQRVSEMVLDWSGGTNIGNSLQMFNQNYASRTLTPHSVVVIISDGWDRGDVRLLGREMQRLKKLCFKTIWLNPLLASEGYEPLCKGMQTALPYLDLFVSVHNLESLVKFGVNLQRLVQ